MLNIKNKVNPDPSITIRWFGSLSKVFERLVIMELIHLKHCRILPLCVVIPLVKFNSMIEVFGNFIPILVPWCCPIGSQLSLVDHPEELLVSLSNGFELFPAISFQGVVIPDIDGTSDRIIGSNNQ